MTDEQDVPAGAQPAWALWLIRLLKLIAATSLFLMAVLTFVDVVGRYFNSPIFGAAEMIQFLLAITVFSGFGLATVAGSHISVDILEPWMKRRFPLFRRALMWVCNTTAGVLIAWQILRIGWHGIESGRRSIVLEWPEGWFILLCGLMAGAALILDLARIRSFEPDMEHPEEQI